MGDINVQGPPFIPKGANNSWFRSYRLRDQEWAPNPTLPDGLQNKGWARSRDNNDDVAYLSVKWTPNQWLPRHTHATGAFYIVLEGSMHQCGSASIAVRNNKTGANYDLIFQGQELCTGVH